MRLCVLEERSAGILLPKGCALLSSSDPNVSHLYGLGAFPESFNYCSDFEYDASLSAMVKKFKEPISASHFLFTIQKECWFFLSEIQFLRNGKLLDTRNWRYVLSTQVPTPQQRGVPYGDDGKMLTDGTLSTDFSRAALGIPGGEKRTVTLDLERLTPIRTVTAHFLDGGSAGITMPQHAEVRFSEDGETWSEPHPLTVPASERLPRLVVKPASARVEIPAARYIRFEMTARTWAFVTEISAE